MPGAVHDHENFSDSEVWYPAGTAGAWHDLNGTTFTDDGTWFHSDDSSNPASDDQIWDSACLN